MRASQLFTFAGVFFLSTIAAAENMQTAGSLGAGDLALGIEPQAAIADNTPFTINFHQGVGLKGGFDLYIREGLGVSNAANGVYIGAGVKWTVLSGRSGSRPGIAFLFGGHFLTDANRAGADAAFIIDIPLSGVTPYAGLDANFEFFDNDAVLFLTVNGGARISVATNISWFVEGGIGVAGEPKFHFVATGPRISI